MPPDPPSSVSLCPAKPLLKFLHPPLISSDPQKRPDSVKLSAVTTQREQIQCRHTSAPRSTRSSPCSAQYRIYSGKLRIMFKEKTVARWVWFPLIRRRGFRFVSRAYIQPRPSKQNFLDPPLGAMNVWSETGHYSRVPWSMDSLS